MDYAADRIHGTRDYQQDEFGIVDGDDLLVEGEALKVFVVADGMGGHNSGEQASGAAVLGFVHHFAQTQGPVTDRLRATLDHANQSLFQKIQQDPELRGMGTTLMAAAVTATTLQWISVGDSKLRLYRPTTGELRRVNADHSMAPVLDALEQDDQSISGLDKNALRSALMGEDIPMVDVSSQPMRLQPGDVLLLASDGLDVLDDDEISPLLANAHNSGAQQVVQRLLQAVEAKALPDQDNTTAMVVLPTPGVQVAGGQGGVISRKLMPWLLGLGGLLLVVLAAVWMLGSDEPATDDSSNPDLPVIETLEEEEVGIPPPVNDEPENPAADEPGQTVPMEPPVLDGDAVDDEAPQSDTEQPPVNVEPKVEDIEQVDEDLGEALDE